MHNIIHLYFDMAAGMCCKLQKESPPLKNIYTRTEQIFLVFSYLLTYRLSMKKILLLFLALAVIFTVYALPYKISYLTADNGLSRNLVEHIFQDSRGFMWISTSKGLDRYDGYEFMHFNSRVGGTPFKSDYVQCVQEDSDGNLWIGTENGLYHLNYKTGEISPANKVIESKINLETSNINFINKDEQGNLWAGYNSGLICITRHNGVFRAEKIYNSTAPLRTMLQYNGNIYVSQGNEVFRIIKNSTGKFQRAHADEKIRNLGGIVNVMINDNGQIWIGTSAGLYKFEPATGALATYLANPSNPSSLTSSYIADIKKYKEGQVAIGTLMGLNIYNYQTNSFSRISSEPNTFGIVLNNNFVNCLWIENDRIWIGTDKGGINMLSPDQNLFRHIVHNPGNQGSLSKNPVNAIYENPEGDLFVGTVEGGLNIRRKGSDTFMHLTSQAANERTISHNSVSSICRDVNGDYWLGTWGGGINRLKYKNGNVQGITRFLNDGTPNSPSGYFVASVLNDDENMGIWTGMREGLDFLDLQTGQFIHILDYLPAEKRIQLVTGLFIDSKRRLWIGTGAGLFCIYLDKSDPRLNKIKYSHFPYLLTNPSSGITEKINCIIETKDKSIWFGSNGNGIYKLDEKGGKSQFINFDEHTGLLDNVIYGMVEDETGTIWLSTDKGLCAFNAGRNSIRSYTTSDGLISNQFYWDAYLKGNDGKIYFGSVNGITVFDPLNSLSSDIKNVPTITRIKVLNEDVMFSKAGSTGSNLIFDGAKLTGIELHETDKAFSVEFSALSYHQTDRIKYAYRLKGFDDHWTEVASDRRFASYTNIGHGQYTLEVKCTNSDGTWSDQVATLEIGIIPPFYKKWWFIVILIFALAYFAYSFYRHRINSLKTQKIKLKQLVDERTSEIEHQKEILQEQSEQLNANMVKLLEQQDELSRQNDALTVKNEKITHQKEELLRLSRKVHEINADRISFFTNITHEFRTPITLISGPIERALKLSTNPLVIEQLGIVRRNSRLLLTLINQLMDFRKVESGKMELVRTQQNFIGFLDTVILPFEEMVKDRGITFRRQYRIMHPEFMFDTGNMEKVMGNLLSNAVKFTPDNGMITIIASTFTDRKDGIEKLYIAVKDTGKGVPPDETEKIFDRFYQSKHNQPVATAGQSGTGIGLYLCKKIILLHDGRIDMRNQPGGGSIFRFIIPVERRIGSVMTAEGPNMQEMLVATTPNEANYDEPAHGKPVLLIVEDNSDMRQYIRSILSSDFHILEAPDGNAGLEVTNRSQPDLIISDIMMPGMDGLEFCKRVKSSFATSHIPVLLLTAKTSTDTQIESFHHGADAFLVKPFDEDLLKAMIRNLREKLEKVQINFAEKMDAASLDFDAESPDKKFIDKALKVIGENYTNPDFDVSELIEQMGISRSLLHKKLTHLAGQSASRFIRIYRLNVARELLIKNRESHALNISQVAYEVGFNDPKYFTRCFTKHFGIQPSSFADENKTAKNIVGLK